MCEITLCLHISIFMKAFYFQLEILYLMIVRVNVRIEG